MCFRPVGFPSENNLISLWVLHYDAPHTFTACILNLDFQLPSALLKCDIAFLDVRRQLEDVAKLLHSLVFLKVSMRYIECLELIVEVGMVRNCCQDWLSGNAREVIAAKFEMFDTSLLRNDLHQKVYIILTFITRLTIFEP